MKLYLVPTPVGNLDDITLRAVKVLQSVDGILAEDTRTTGFLLKHLGIGKTLHSYHIFNEHGTIQKIIGQLKAGKTLALVSDAGTPAISDPGFLLVRACIDADIPVECLPGATAFVPALVNSGLPTDRFTFEGFLPHKKGKQTRIQALADETRTMIFYESPHRLLKTLEQLAEVFGPDRPSSVSRELTKLFEETVRGTLADVQAYFAAKPIKGEIVLCVGGKPEATDQKRNKKGDDYYKQRSTADDDEEDDE
jgi:16S rRNA (cytidine1402-2'-O)-methyltransferase